MDKLYENIRKRRIALGMTQQDLADKLGYRNRSAIARIESGDIDLSQSKIIQFAKALQASPRELFGETEYLKVPADGPRDWYDDPTVRTVTDKLKDNDNYRVLFEAVSKVKPEDIDFVTSFIKRMGGDL